MQQCRLYILPWMNTSGIALVTLFSQTLALLCWDKNLYIFYLTVLTCDHMKTVTKLRSRWVWMCLYKLLYDK